MYADDTTLCCNIDSISKPNINIALNKETIEYLLASIKQTFFKFVAISYINSVALTNCVNFFVYGKS